MKTRHSFVSNSSSSSFVLVGIAPEWRGDNTLYHKILDAVIPPGIREDPGAFYDSEQSRMYDYGMAQVDDSLIARFSEDLDFYEIGLPAEDRLNQDMRVSEIAEELCLHLKANYGITCEASGFKLHFGECGSG